MTQAAILAASGSPGTTTGFKNRIINGNMVIDQRNGGASVTPTGNAFTLDRWNVNDSATGVFTVQQNAGSVTPPPGFTNYLGVTSIASTSVTAGVNFCLRTQIEGFNIGDLAWGTASAKTVTLSFWVRSSLTGQFGGAFENAATNRSYPFNYTISAANTWQQISVTVPGDTSGPWSTDNGCGIRVWFGLGTGSNFAGVAGSWQAADYRGATSSVNVVSTNGATWYLTGVQLEVGTTATNFEFRDYGRELMLCQRYYWQQSYTVIYENILDPCRISATDAVTGAFFMPVTMRTAPSFTNNGVGNFRVNNSLGQDQTCNGITVIGSNTNKVVLTFTKATANMTVAGSGYINTEGANDAAVYFSAEL